ncbi:pre-mRNA-splicing factor CWC25 family protein [Ornithinibacillus californiensis]|uniref:pre-mRNA-splicing factor CWC25 family protein n=1 Tax=Ornithinibacillus californiensis TaxID=161536 RepID=UPI00064DF43E|nr:pre-mRNA-splicing factor CWC25 family protein [Ornithinibacillus californiensis]
MDVWYASYGSNLMEDRFLAYIYGGTPPGSNRPERGARDKTPPKRNERVDIPYPLYFAKERSKWGIGGVAFIGTGTTNEESTIGRMYLIKEEQFYDVVSQENNGVKVDLDLEVIERKGFIDIHDGWYNRIVFLGRKDGAPIFTFTSSLPIHMVSLRKPSAPYLSVIAKGLKELGFVKEEIEDYLLGKKGIDGFLTKNTLNNFINF